MKTLSITKALSLLTFATSISLSAQASDNECQQDEECYRPTGLYIGGDYGVTRSNFDSNDAGLSNENYQVMLDDTDDSFSFFLGYQFDDNWAAQIGYRDLGGNSYVVSEPLAIDSERPYRAYPDAGDGYYLMGLYSWPVLERVKLTAKIGVMDWDNDYRLSTRANENQYLAANSSGTDVFFGAEASYQVLPSLQLYTGFQRNTLTVQDVDIWSFGGRYFFASQGTKAKRNAGSVANLQETPVEAPAEPTPAETIEPVASYTERTNVNDNDGDGVNNDKDVCRNTPAGEAVDAYGCSQQSAQTASFDLIMYFAHDSTAIGEQYEDKLEDLAKFIKQNNIQRLEIVGHASAQGPESYNLKLSKRRADAVAKKLANQFAINKDIMVTIGKGESELIDLVNDDNNRRIQVFLKEELK